MIRRHIMPMLLVFFCLGLAVPDGARAQESPDRARGEAAGEPASTSDWLVAGTFKGSTHGGLLGTLSNVVFEYENDESLFRDFGDLGIGIGVGIGSVETDLDLNFRRRVVSNHEILPPGETIEADDLSVYRNVNASRTRLRLNYEYIPEVFTDSDGVGVQVEGGYSVSVSRAHRSATGLESPLDGLIEDPPEGVDDEVADPGVVYVTAESAASVVGSISGFVGNKLADTERAAIYWDDYAAPIMLFPQTGLPLKMKVFLRDDPGLAVGDKLTFTSFVAVSPIVAGINQYGARIGLRYYWRFLRETTVEKNEGGFLTVRVRNWQGRGTELTPFKFRPEVRLWFFTIGYTFFETVRDRFKESTSEAVYRIDLGTDEGMERFRRLIKQSGKITVTPKKPEAFEENGVETLVAELNRGKNQNFRLRANLFNWLRYRRTRIGTTRRVHAREADLDEAYRITSSDYRKTLGRNRDTRSRMVVRAQSDFEWRDPSAAAESEVAIQFSGSFTDRYATARDAGALVRAIQTMLDLEAPPVDIEDLEGLGDTDLGRLTAHVDLSLGSEALRLLAASSDEQIWEALGRILLGPDHGAAWRTAENRYWWEPGAPVYKSDDPPIRGIGRHYDARRGFTGRPAKRSRVFNPLEYKSRDLYGIAKKTRKKLEKLDVLFREDPDCLKCLVRGFTKGIHTVLIQAVAVHLAGGVDSGAVGYDYSVLVGDMVVPASGTNNVLHGFRLARGGMVLPTAEQTWESPPRLRAGQFLLNVSGAAAELGAADSCGMIRLFADHRFAEDLSLRIVYRNNRGVKVDDTLVVDLAGLGEPLELTEEVLRDGVIDYREVQSERGLTSEFSSFEDRVLSAQHGVNPFTGRFEQAKYFYEVLVPRFEYKPTKKGITILLRVVNTKGDAVTEEQEILLQPPKGTWDRVPVACWDDDAIELAKAEPN